MCCGEGHKAYKRRLAYSVKVRISAKNFVLEYKAEELNLYVFLCVPWRRVFTHVTYL